MLLWKEWRETLPLICLSAVAICGISLVRWEGWRLEFFEVQFWAVAALGLPFIALFLGAGAIASERENGTLDNLLSRPVRLWKVFLTKYVADVANILLLLAVLTAAFYLMRPTHNVKAHDLLRGLVILFAFLLFFLTMSFSVSCCTDTSAKAVVASVVLIYMTLFVVNSTPLFRYAWWWRHSLDEMWLEYFLFYGSLSLIVATIGVALFTRRVMLDYGWKHLAVVGILFFLIFVRSVSTTFWFFAETATSGNFELVQIARGSVHEILEAMSRGMHWEQAQLLEQLLASTTSSDVERDLKEELTDTNPAIRNEAVKILTYRKSEAASAAVIPLLNDSDSQVRHSALNFVGALKCKEAVPAVIDLLHDPNSSIRTRAVHALAEIEGKDATPYLMEALKDRNPKVSSVAAFRLCQLGYAEAQDEIVRMMFEDPVKNTRRNIAQYLGYMKSAPACEALMEALSDDDPRLVANAIASLGDLQCEDSLDSLVRYWNISPWQRPSIISAMRGIGSPKAVTIMKELFSDPETGPAMKIDIAVALAETGDATGISYVREHLVDETTHEQPDWRKRDYAVRLARAGEFSAVPMLIPWLEKGHPASRYEYGKILTKLTGKEYGWASERWRKWWDKNKDTLLQTVPEVNGKTGGD